MTDPQIVDDASRPVQAHQYRCLKVVQQVGAPPFYLTFIAARDLVQWSDVPRAKIDYMAGYQRVLNDARTVSIANYLKASPSNLMPGAIIVAVDIDYVSVTEDGGISTISIAADNRSFQDKLMELFGSFTTRLSTEELGSTSIEFTASDEDPDQEETEYPSSYIATLAEELSAAISGWESIPKERQLAIEEFINGASKPGLIIDGQHRVFGACDAEEDVLLPVVLLPGLAHAEQVFQFYVLNSKARPLTPTELRRIVSASLTNQEIGNLFARFKQTGINAEESRWTLQLNTRPESPFRGLIDFGGNHDAPIKENVADQLVRAFMLTRKYRALTDTVGDNWTDVTSRLGIFFDFWSAVKKHYSAAWTEAELAAESGKQHQLFTKVTLLTLQRFILDHFVTALPYRSAAALPPLSSATEIDAMVASTLRNLPDKFFRNTWQAKQIDTHPGRKRLYEAMQLVWADGQGRVHGNMWPFRDS